MTSGYTELSVQCSGQAITVGGRGMKTGGHWQELGLSKRETPQLEKTNVYQPLKPLSDSTKTVLVQWPDGYRFIPTAFSFRDELRGFAALVENTTNGLTYFIVSRLLRAKGVFSLYSILNAIYLILIKYAKQRRHHLFCRS